GGDDEDAESAYGGKDGAETEQEDFGEELVVGSWAPQDEGCGEKDKNRQSGDAGDDGAAEAARVRVGESYLGSDGGAPPRPFEPLLLGRNHRQRPPAPVARSLSFGTVPARTSARRLRSRWSPRLMEIFDRIIAL